MCYYEQTAYICRDWKWGNMKERCPRQHRMGETCGVKLVHDGYLTHSNEKCRVCKDIEIKQRKLDKEKQNIARWSKEGKKFLASIEKAENEIEHLSEAIEMLESSRPVSKVGLAPRSSQPIQADRHLSNANATHHVQQMKDNVDRHATYGVGGGRHGHQGHGSQQQSTSNGADRRTSLPYRTQDQGKSNRHGGG